MRRRDNMQRHNLCGSLERQASVGKEKTGVHKGILGLRPSTSH